MFRLRLFRNLRTLAYLTAMAGLIGAAVLLVWANHIGLPASWRAAIERELAKSGIHATIGSLSLHPLKGIVAKEVVLYSDPERTQDFCHLENLLIDVDKTKIARGVVHLTKVELSHASIDLHIAPATGPPETLEIRNLSGSLLMPGGRLVELRNASAQVAGFRVGFGAKLLKYRPTGQQITEDTGKEGRLLAISQLVRELRNWRFDRESPPTLRCFIEGDLSDWSSLVLRVSLHAKGVEKNGHVIDEIGAEGTYAGSLLSLTSVHAQDSHGTFDGRVDYDVWGSEGRFDLTSSVNMPKLLHSWVGWAALDSITFTGSQSIETEGTFKLRPDAPPEVVLTGHARCTDVRIKGVPIQVAAGSFSWRDNQLYLRDLCFERADGRATGKAMIQWPLVRMSLHTTLPIPVYRPFFVNQPLEPVLKDFGELPDAKVDVTLDGGFDASDPESWAYTGSGRVENVTFRGVPVNSARCNLSLSHHELDFFDGVAVFNFKDYPLRKAHGGPLSGTLKAERIRFDGPTKTVFVTGVSGTTWAAPVVRTFAPDIANTLEIYGFRQPPDLTASGVVDVTPAGRTDLTVSFRSRDAADYVFLGKPLVLDRPSGTVAIRGPKVHIRNLETTACGGPVRADITVAPQGRISCEATWTDVSMDELNKVYNLNVTCGGELTGRAELSFIDNRIETMAGEGLISIERSVLFSAPVAGPLSGLLATVLGDKRAGFEKAKSAFCTFTIKNGVLYTPDFTTSTTSLVFAADGSVDLTKRTLDANVRVNARGLLGIVTLPLRPFSGLFQFRGTGSLNDPKWVNEPVSKPLPEQEKLLLQPPRAKPVEPPRRRR